MTEDPKELVARLRRSAEHHGLPLMGRAADLIDRLTADRERSVGEDVEPETVPGRVVCHCSEDDGVPDVGVSIGLGSGKALWLGELLTRDGGDIGFVLHGPSGQREVAPIWPNCEWQEVADMLRYHVAPAIAAAPAPALPETGVGNG